MPKNSVRGLLATGNVDQQRMFFHAVCFQLNTIQGRGQTMHYTCMENDLSFAIEQAQRLKVTLQEIVHEDGEEKYVTLVQGDLPGWQPKAKDDAESEDQNEQ